MRELVYYLPGSSESSPSLVASHVWRHLYDARSGLEPDLRLLADDPKVRERYGDVAIGHDEVGGLVAEGLFYFPLSPVLGLDPASRLRFRLWRRGARLVCDCHGDLREDLYNHMMNRETGMFLYAVPSAVAAPLVLNWHEAVVLHSRYLEGILRRRYDLRARTIVVPNGIDRRLLDSAPGRTDLGGEFNVCFHGRHAHEKGLDILIDAVASLPVQLRRRVHLHVLGEGPLTSRLARRASWAGVDGQAHFLGYLPLDDAYSVIRSADAVFYPSRFDNFPVAVLEALAIADGPVFFSDHMGIGEFAGPSLSGCKIPPTVAAVRAAIVDVLDGRVDVGAVVSAQRACATRYTWDRVVPEYVRFFNDLD